MFVFVASIDWDYDRQTDKYEDTGYLKSIGNKRKMNLTQFADLVITNAKVYTVDP